MILAKIINDNNTTTAVVPDYLVSVQQQNQDININTQELLKEVGYEKGRFNLTYYVIEDDPLYDIDLSITAISSNFVQIKSQFDRSLKSIDFDQVVKPRLRDEVIEFENSYQKQSTKLLAQSSKTVEVVTDLKYNLFTDTYVLRFSEEISLQKNQKFKLYKLNYEPIQIEYVLLDETNTIETTVLYQYLDDPLFDTPNINNNSLQNKTLNDLLTEDSGAYDIPLALSNISQNAIYDASIPSNFIHFGTYQSRLDAFALKYYQLYNYSSSLTAPKSKFVQMFNTFNSFEKYCLFDSKVITTVSGVNSVIGIADTDSFMPWYHTKSITASLYDSENSHSLIKMLPQIIATNEDNEDLFTMVNLMGDTYDQYWAAIKTIPSLTTKLECELEHLGQNFLKDILIGQGFDYKLSFPSQGLVDTFFQTPQFNNNTMSYSRYNKILLSRLVANMPFLLRKKGTRNCIEQILNIYGMSTDLIDVYEIIKDSGISIFDVFNTTQTFYTISNTVGSGSLQFKESKYNTNDAENISMVMIGTATSNHVHRHIVNSSSLDLSSFNNLLSANEYRETQSWPSTVHPQLYMEQFDRDTYDFTISHTFGDIVNFYESIDNTIFSTIKQFTPYHSAVKTGIMLDNDVFNRNKIPTMDYIKRYQNQPVIKRNYGSVLYTRLDHTTFTPEPTDKLHIDISYKTELPTTVTTILDIGHHVDEKIRDKKTNRSLIRDISAQRINVYEDMVRVTCPYVQARYLTDRVTINTPSFYRSAVPSCTDGVAWTTSGVIGKYKMIIDNKQQITSIKLGRT